MGRTIGNIGSGSKSDYITFKGKDGSIIKVAKDANSIKQAIAEGAGPNGTPDWDAINGIIKDPAYLESKFPKGSLPGASPEEVTAYSSKQMEDLNKEAPIFDYTNEQGLLNPEYQSNLDLSGAQSAYSKAAGAQDELMGMARDTALTPYAKTLMDRQALEEGKQRSDLTAQTNTAVNSGLRTLGTTGGYDSGARERMALQASRMGATGGQNIGQQSAYSRLGIQQEDLGRKYDILTGAPTAYTNLSTQSANLAGQDTANQRYNLATAMDQKRKAEAAKLQRYGLGKNIEAAQTEANLIQ